jgi:outer membrane protein assembly factor BamD (BamD/ComL family)
MKKLIYVIILFSLIACSSNNKEDRVEAINESEKEIEASVATAIDNEKAEALIQLYVDFVKDFPEDYLADVYLFKAADLSLNIGKYKQAVEFYQQLREDYPESENAEISLFMQAFIYDYHLRDFQNAKQKYEAFLKSYPESEFSMDAEISLEQLGKSPENIMKEFEMNQQDSLVSDSLI